MINQYIVHDGLKIYGTGTSMMAATLDASRNCPDLLTITWPNGFANITDMGDPDTIRGIEVQRCTGALALQLENEGGAITWDELDGIACTGAEFALDLAAPLMDDAIREDIHSNFAAASDAAEFLAEYACRHEAQFGERFDV